MKDNYSKNNLDDILKQLGKAYRKLNGTRMPAEIILVGGSAIIAGYGFRDSTTDLDACIQASSVMKEAINKVGDDNGLSNGWLNDDFKKTASYSDKIVQYSVPYRTFSNVLHVRTLPPEYIVAMKLASLRAYKHDKSDIVGLVKETGIEKDEVERAILDLYGSWENLQNHERAMEFIDTLYEEINNREAEAFSMLVNIDKNYDDLLNMDNANNIVEMAQRSKISKLEDYLRTEASRFSDKSSNSCKEAEIIIERILDEGHMSVESYINALSNYNNERIKVLTEAIMEEKYLGNETREHYEERK